jgi:transcriptional regulator with XRE-family HTH domain
MSARQSRELGRQLRKARKAAGASLKQVAPRVGVDYTHLSKIETGAAMPSRELLAKLAGQYASDADEFFMEAGMLPPDVETIISSHLRESVEILRKAFGADK